MPVIKRLCKDCGVVFDFDEGEQAFFAKKHFDEPKRCVACRKKVRDRKKTETGGNRSEVGL